jgi:hypothetical protein
MRPRRNVVECHEAALGHYTVPSLEFELGAGKLLLFEPVGRDIVDAEGRVDLYLQGAASEGYMLLWKPFTPALGLVQAGEPGLRPDPLPREGWMLWRKLGLSGVGRLLGADVRVGGGKKLTRETLEEAVETLIG